MKLANATAYFHVHDVRRAIEFYVKLGFEVRNTVDDQGVPTWVWLDSGGASLMLARASEPFDCATQAAMLYLYTADVPALHAELTAKGITCGKITKPFYAPNGEFRVMDPDGWVLMFTHT